MEVTYSKVYISLILRNYPESAIRHMGTTRRGSHLFKSVYFHNISQSPWISDPSYGDHMPGRRLLKSVRFPIISQ